MPDGAVVTRPVRCVSSIYGGLARRVSTQALSWHATCRPHPTRVAAVLADASPCVCRSQRKHVVLVGTYTARVPVYSLLVYFTVRVSISFSIHLHTPYIPIFVTL